MKKILYITLKDLLILFHDRAAFILMLAAPFTLTLAMGAVSGAFSQTTTTGIQSIPVSVANQDEGPMGSMIVKSLSSDSLEGLFSAAEEDEPANVRLLVENDQVSAGIIIPAGYSSSIFPNPQNGKTGPAAPVEIYLNPARPVTSGIVQSVITELVNNIDSGPVQVQIQIVLASADTQPEQDEQNFMAYLAPGMAIFFLMYTVTQGGRSILAEKQMGTLVRLLSTPTSSVQILAGKVFSVFTAGFLQVSVLIMAAALLFSLNWGNPLGVSLLIAATAAAATGWGILLASFAKTTAQVSSVGTAIMLTFGVLGGSFIPTSTFSPFVQLVSKITPNAWALDGFNILANGGEVVDLFAPITALLVMAVVLFGVSISTASRR
jgi:ABC-2 type transport system permease protein